MVYLQLSVRIAGDPEIRMIKYLKYFSNST